MELVQCRLVFFATFGYGFKLHKLHFRLKLQALELLECKVVFFASAGHGLSFCLLRLATAGSFSLLQNIA